MQAFAWRGRNNRGELVNGVLDADDLDAVAAQLMAGGVIPISIGASGASLSAPKQDLWRCCRRGRSRWMTAW